MKRLSVFLLTLLVSVSSSAFALESGQCVQTINSNLPVSSPKYVRANVAQNITRLWVLQFTGDTFSCSDLPGGSQFCASLSGGANYLLSSPVTSGGTVAQTITKIDLSGSFPVIELSANVSWFSASNFKFYYTAADGRTYIGYIGAFGVYGWLTTMSDNTCPAPVL